MAKDFVYLASASPRRRELLGQIGVTCEVEPADIDEARHPGELPEAYVMRVAAAKAAEVWQRVAGGERQAPVLAADTVVLVDGVPLGKPADVADAERMLERLSGRRHAVLTAVAVRFADTEKSVLARSEVRFRATTAAERSAYCRTGEPLDKAGAYGIQGLGAVFIEALTGSYSAVMGLPLFETAVLLRQFGLPAWLAGGERPL
jgi:septum formation protein